MSTYSGGLIDLSPAELEEIHRIKTEAFHDITSRMLQNVDKHGIEHTPLNVDLDLGRVYIILGEEFGEIGESLSYDKGSAEDYEHELIDLMAAAISALIAQRMRNVKASGSEGNRLPS